MFTLASLLASGEAGAQSVADLHMGTWAGSLDAGYAYEHQRTHASDGSPETDAELRRIQEGLTIRNEGFNFLNPQVATGNLGLTFGLVHERNDVNGTENYRRANLTGYAFDSTFLAASPYNGTLYANRTENLLTQPFGQTGLIFENYGGMVRLREDSSLKDWGLPYLSANMRAEQQHTKETTISIPGQTFRRDELRNILSLDGHKGFETADLGATYEFNDLNDSVLANLSFQSQTANLHYSSDFGPSLNRRSDTRVFYYTRSGASPISIFTANETLHIDHQQNLYTDYRYLLTHTDTLSGSSTLQSGIFDLQHKPYRDLTTTAQVMAQHEELPTGTRDIAAGQLALLYRHGLQGGGSVFGRVSGRYQLNDNQLDASQINVTDEPHVAPTPLGAGAGFPLDQTFVVTSSIVVVDTRGGARLATAPGTDYDIVVEGNLTRIVPVATSAVIRAGDPLAVSYTYEVDPSLKYGTTARWISGGADFRWISFAAAHEESDQKLLAGQDSGFLQDVRQDTAQVDLRGAWKALQGQAGAAYVHYDATSLAYRQERYTGHVSFLPTHRFTLAVNADRTLTDYTLPAHETDARAARLTLEWHPWGGWTATAEAGRRLYKDSEQPTETINEAALKARVTYGKLDLTSAVAASDRTRGGFQSTDLHVDMMATRRF